MTEKKAPLSKEKFEKEQPLAKKDFHCKVSVGEKGYKVFDFKKGQPIILADLPKGLEQNLKTEKVL